VFSVLQHNHVVALKMGLAYHRLLSFEKVDVDVAENIFVTKEKSKEQIKLLQDFIVNYLVNTAGSESLTVQIHTGYLHGNNGNLGNGHPLLMVPLFRRFPETKFVIFHGSYPWIGDFVAIGKEFTNVNLDLVWLPQLSQTAAKRGLHELLDAVPYNKICWGGDVGKIDETAGSLELAKETVTEVLTERINMGIISESTALDICNCIFRNNAIRIYDLRDLIEIGSEKDIPGY
jgi:predicted TIM-barrel fold metal-dependent hydrolase